ncbi:MAG TPA: helix-turn-helix domain-containing protein [Acidimicrobiales bacterium]|nr:helix-turn-helix domain-containing protein [Acidimicrobiales bacterium]
MPIRPSPQTERVVEVCDLLAHDTGAGLSLAEISRRLGVHKASCYSMLTALVGAGWLLRDPVRKTYQLGPGLVRLGSAAASQFPALDLARPAMAELSAATGAHCIAFTIGPDHVTVVDQVRHPQAAGHPMPVGTELPRRPPYGVTLAAWMNDAEREGWLDGVPGVVRDRYRRVLDMTRRRGYAVGLHVLADVRLLELASLIRATDARHGRLGSLAGALTDEIMLSEDWFPATVSPRRRYNVSHVDSAVLGPGGRPVLVISLVPVATQLTGAEVVRIGTALAERTAAISGVLSGGSRAAVPS